ncbi:LptF/LptG family permease [Pedobacter sp. KR3-3]|uniref:LptF/LptG family permease n=1 Tax=Pedobacter albus TaxID=3113905 RepID=A0ABU7I7B9_9SPHI|nr:LptF/LptG family permease [Pedobacter sp. KR3-3]MEE1945374.1 LptF/LptG family permease [Pedobacter sp. KR3-3]
MKKIHLLLIKAFIRPFFVTFFIVMFILLMFFLFKYIDDLIGKGFEWYTIAEVMLYASAANVAMALPLAVLLSSIMTFGSLGENYELVAIKSAGVSLQKAMRPLFVFIIGLSFASFLFSDYMLPKANLKYGSLLYDMRNKKLSFLIKPGVFNNSIQNYAMRVERKGEGAIDSLYGIMIYDHTGTNGIPKIILAEKGRMAKTSDDQYLVLSLVNGVRYEENSSSGSFNPRQTLTRMRFKQTEVKFDLGSFGGFNRTQEASFKNNAPMLNRGELLHREDSIKKSLDSLNKTTKVNASAYFKQNEMAKGYTKVKVPAKVIKGSILNAIPKNLRIQAVQSGYDQAETIKQIVINRILDFDFKSKEIIRAQIEYQRKYTLAVSCLLLFFIGAPLGAIIRKGGLGLPVVIAIVFFLIYHILSTVAEKSAKEGSLDPNFGMWVAIIILTPLGIFLTYKATVDSALFDIDYYKQLIVGLFKKKESKKSS